MGGYNTKAPEDSMSLTVGNEVVWLMRWRYVTTPTDVAIWGITQGNDVLDVLKDELSTLQQFLDHVALPHVSTKFNKVSVRKLLIGDLKTLLTLKGLSIPKGDVCIWFPTLKKGVFSILWCS